MRRRAWEGWGILVLAAVVVLLALPLLLLFDISRALDDSDEIPDDVRGRLERIEEDRAFRWTAPGAREVDEGMTPEVCDGSSTTSATAWRVLEFTGSPERFAERMTDRFTDNGWTASPTSATVVGFRRGFGTWTGDVVVVVKRRGVADVTGRADDGLTVCNETGVD